MTPEFTVQIRDAVTTHGFRWYMRVEYRDVFSELKQALAHLQDSRPSVLTWHAVNDQVNVPICSRDGCTTPVKWHATTQYSQFCSSKCRAIGSKGYVDGHGVSLSFLSKVSTNPVESVTHALAGNSVAGAARQIGVCRKSLTTNAKRLGLANELAAATKRPVSGFEVMMANIFDSHGLTFIRNDRSVIAPQELDFVFPDQKIAIEINGLAFHSEVRGGKGRSYHKNKMKSARAAGYDLIQVYDVELLGDKVRSRTIRRVLSRLGVYERTTYARRTTCRPIDATTARSFLEYHHTQDAISAKVRYGLYTSSDELVAVMTFGKARYASADWELYRFASAGRVVGGASKLFARFVLDHTPTTVVSYSDNRWGAGGVYEALQFVKQGTSQPNYWYFLPDEASRWYHRTKFQKHKLQDLLVEYNASDTEWANMQSAGYDRVWDCGSTTWIWTAGRQLPK